MKLRMIRKFTAFEQINVEIFVLQFVCLLFEIYVEKMEDSRVFNFYHCTPYKQ